MSLYGRRVFGTAAAAVLLVLPAQMGRGRCEALTGPERDKCFAEDRANAGVQRSDAKK